MATGYSYTRLSLLAIVVAAISALLLVQASSDEPESQVTAVADPVTAPSDIAPSLPPAKPDLPGRDVLRGVDINGSVDLNPDGTLSYTLSLRHLFDHFLSMAGESDKVPAARSALAAHIDTQRVSEVVGDHVLTAFDHYVEYLHQAETIALNAYEADDMARTFTLLAELRRSVLGRDLAEAFFGADEARETYLTGQRRIATDPTLSANEKARQLAALERALPEDMQQARRQATAVIRLQDETRALRAAGASDGVIHYLREEQVGPEAANRLRELDERRADWQQRLNRYHRERDRLINSAGLADQDRELLMSDLRARYFSGPEVRRIRALDRLAEATR